MDKLKCCEPTQLCNSGLWIMLFSGNETQLMQMFWAYTFICTINNLLKHENEMFQNTAANTLPVKVYQNHQHSKQSERKRGLKPLMLFIEPPEKKVSFSRVRWWNTLCLVRLLIKREPHPVQVWSQLCVEYSHMLYMWKEHYKVFINSWIKFDSNLLVKLHLHKSNYNRLHSQTATELQDDICMMQWFTLTILSPWCSTELSKHLLRGFS